MEDIFDNFITKIENDKKKLKNEYREKIKNNFTDINNNKKIIERSNEKNEHFFGKIEEIFNEKIKKIIIYDEKKFYQYLESINFEYFMSIYISKNIYEMNENSNNNNNIFDDEIMDKLIHMIMFDFLKYEDLQNDTNNISNNILEEILKNTQAFEEFQDSYNSYIVSIKNIATSYKNIDKI
jgi:hypothetical protein